MLQERDYMRRGNDSGSNAKSGELALFSLIVINILMFFVGETPQGGERLCLNVGALNQLELWRPLTAIFLHDGFFHIFFNMIGLYFFGMVAAPLLGAKRFVWLFLVSGLAGNLLWYACNIVNPFMTVVGASGAVMGVIMGAAMLRPNIQAYVLFIPFPIKLKTLAIVYILLEIFSQLSGTVSPVAYLAHIGGFFGGMIFMKIFASKDIQWNPFSSKKNPQNHFYRPEPQRPNIHFATYDPGKGAPVPQYEIDRLLDKLSRTGINSLTETEQETLRRAREEMLKRQ